MDDVARKDVIQLVETFPNQAIDFYSALRSRLYDEQIRDFIQSVGLEKISRRVANPKDPLPEFRKPNFSLSHLIEVGQEIVREQKRIQELRLSEEYNKSLFMSRKLGDTAPRGGRRQEAGVRDQEKEMEKGGEMEKGIARVPLLNSSVPMILKFPTVKHHHLTPLHLTPHIPKPTPAILVNHPAPS